MFSDFIALMELTLLKQPFFTDVAWNILIIYTYNMPMPRNCQNWTKCQLRGLHVVDLEVDVDVSWSCVILLNGKWIDVFDSY